jgi:hypothetical protein
MNFTEQQALLLPDRKGRIFSMRDLVFIGFFCGPGGLGIALFQSLKRVGEPGLGAKALKIGIAVGMAELVVLVLIPMQVVYLHFAGGVLAKLAHDRWLMRPAFRYRENGGKNATKAHLFAFWFIFTLGFLATAWSVISLVGLIQGE